ncbi:MAG: hypothetical protein HKL95_01575, partial [Phycisphaerae bacterium]|nr:hypothetical protein [Phycisphaerae bacterium]
GSGLANANAALDSAIGRLDGIVDTSTGTVLEQYSYLGLSTIVARNHPQTGINLTLVGASGSIGSGGDVGLDRFGRVVDQNWVDTSTGQSTDNFTCSYDANSNVTAKNNLLNTAYSETYTYDPANNRLTSANAAGVYTSTYDARNALVALAEPGGKIVTYSYDPANLRTAMAAYGKGTYSYIYDPANRQTQTINPQLQTTTIAYDNASRIIQRQFSNGAVTSQSYDAASNLIQVVNIANQFTATLTYGYNKANQRVLEQEADGTVTTWTYDNTYQLTNENRSGGPGFGWADMTVDQWANLSVEEWAGLPVASEAATSFNITYTYDPAGNRIQQNDGTTVATLTYSPANRLQLANANGVVTTFTNDAAGNRTAQISASESMYFTWDAAGNMATAEPAAGIVTLTYNADQQRVAKESTDASVTGYLYDYKKLLCETDGEGGAVSQTYLSDTTDEFGDLIGEDGQYIHQYDAQANTDALLDETGTAEAQYKYFAFGQVNAVSVQGGPWTGEDWESLPLDLTSKMLAGGKKQYYLDMEIALYLLGCGNNGRYYDPVTGRFLSEDPTASDVSGTAAAPTTEHPQPSTVGEANLFRYAGNDPINNLDASGHKHKKDQQQQNNEQVQGHKSAPLPHPANETPGVDTGENQIIAGLPPSVGLAGDQQLAHPHAGMSHRTTSVSGSAAGASNGGMKWWPGKNSQRSSESNSILAHPHSNAAQRAIPAEFWNRNAEGRMAMVNEESAGGNTAIANIMMANLAAHPSPAYGPLSRLEAAAATPAGKTTATVADWVSTITSFADVGLVLLKAGLKGLAEYGLKKAVKSGLKTAAEDEAKGGLKAAESADQAAQLQPYRLSGGHHIPAQSAFRGAAEYDPKAALAIPKAELERLGVIHSQVTIAQRALYTAFARTGKPLTWEVAEQIETQSLIRGGMKPAMAKTTVQRAIQMLKDAGVSKPIRIPWGGQ